MNHSVVGQVYESEDLVEGWDRSSQCQSHFFVHSIRPSQILKLGLDVYERLERNIIPVDFDN